MRTEATKRAGKITRDTGWMAIKVGSAALKSVWRNYSALELEMTQAYYLKGCA